MFKKGSYPGDTSPGYTLQVSQPGRLHGVGTCRIHYWVGRYWVTILIKKALPFQITRIWQDPVGRYMGVTGQWGRRDVTLICVYALPRLQAPTMSKVIDTLLETPPTLHVIGGDFNNVRNPSPDNSRGDGDSLATTPLSRFASTLGLVNTW